MSQRNYPQNAEYFAYKQNQRANLFSRDLEDVRNASEEKEQETVFTKIKIAGKVKFILALIYFFSLIYFSIKLFT